jgi:5'-3' exoribonuclease 1
MTRLHSQLKYFISKKITEDSSWGDIEVILSGHDIAGEGEHKIMDYIRLSKSQVDYNPNIRHCIYGLDADLMMLGLVTHEPHFALLREEVTFGRKSKAPKQKGSAPTFFLFHLSLFREYLNLEFENLKGTLKFPYDLERIIDDYVLMCYFIGNDFLPHLSGFDINNGFLILTFRRNWTNVYDL